MLVEAYPKILGSISLQSSHARTDSKQHQEISGESYLYKIEW